MVCGCLRGWRSGERWRCGERDLERMGCGRVRGEGNGIGCAVGGEVERVREWPVVVVERIPVPVQAEFGKVRQSCHYSVWSS